MSKKILDDTGVSDLVNSIATNIANKYATKDEIITANGGNADTLDGKHASDFMPYIGFVDDLFAVKKTCICAYGPDTLNTPLKAGLTQSGGGLCFVNFVNGAEYANYLVMPSGDISYYIATSHQGNLGGGWQKISDNGNAYTVGGKDISQIMATKGWYEGDLNDLKEQGTYLAQAVTNAPANVWGTVIVTAGGTGSFIQIYIPSFVSGYATLWFRHFNGSNWSTWRNSADGGNAATLNNLDAYHMGTVTQQGSYYPPEQYPIYCQYNVGGDGRFKFMVDNQVNPDVTYEVRCDYATDAAAVGGFTANLLLKNVATGNPLTTTINECFVTGTYAIESSFTPDFPSGYGTYGFLDVRAYGSICYQTVRFENGVIINRAAIVGQTNWSPWKKFASIKSTTFSSTADGTGNFNLWAPSENKVPISIQLDNKTFYAVPFLYNNQLWLGSTINEVTRQPVTNTTVSGTIYYIEV